MRVLVITYRNRASDEATVYLTISSVAGDSRSMFPAYPQQAEFDKEQLKFSSTWQLRAVDLR